VLLQSAQVFGLVRLQSPLLGAGNPKHVDRQRYGAPRQGPCHYFHVSTARIESVPAMVGSLRPAAEDLHLDAEVRSPVHCSSLAGVHRIADGQVDVQQENRLSGGPQASGSYRRNALRPRIGHPVEASGNVDDGDLLCSAGPVCALTFRAQHQLQIESIDGGNTQRVRTGPGAHGTLAKQRIDNAVVDVQSVE